tara:strand:+ start:689 stop:1162 length:474 start_codon:yes stop_codon:yes gene_type:complete
MAAELLGGKWAKKADLTVGDAAILAYTQATDLASPLSGTVGNYCVFDMDGGTDADYTEHFDFPILGDFMIVVNPTGVNLGAATTMDVSVQGSADGTNYVDLETDILDGVTIDDAMVTAVYDADAKGIMPYMRLELTAASNARNEAILLQIIPMHKAK